MWKYFKSIKDILNNLEGKKVQRIKCETKNVEKRVEGLLYYRYSVIFRWIVWKNTTRWWANNAPDQLPICRQKKVLNVFERSTENSCLIKNRCIVNDHSRQHWNLAASVLHKAIKGSSKIHLSALHSPHYLLLSLIHTHTHTHSPTLSLIILKISINEILLMDVFLLEWPKFFGDVTIPLSVWRLPQLFHPFCLNGLTLDGCLF